MVVFGGSVFGCLFGEYIRKLCYEGACYKGMLEAVLEECVRCSESEAVCVLRGCVLRVCVDRMY